MGRGWGAVVRARLTGWVCEARLPGGDEGLAKVQWTFAPKNARPVGGPGGRRGRRGGAPACRGTNRARCGDVVWNWGAVLGAHSLRAEAVGDNGAQ